MHKMGLLDWQTKHALGILEYPLLPLRQYLDTGRGRLNHEPAFREPEDPPIRQRPEP